ncbi:MAG TPA: hypothetical protein VGR69_06095 [Candidatus Rubrimentiphilum sp.]|nr:hypothetical protein [Candidatus Rubrimentiphilum sp.]
MQFLSTFESRVKAAALQPLYHVFAAGAHGWIELDSGKEFHALHGATASMG